MDFAKLDLKDNQVLARIIIKEAITKKFRDRDDFQRFRNKVTKRENGIIFHNLYFIKAYNDLVEEGEIQPNDDFFALIQKRRVRTLSGVAPVTVLTKPFPCPGRCVYCPTDVRMPKSYLPSQPAAQRGFRQQFNPYTQVIARLKALHMTGHAVSKVELRVLGGTWSSYPKAYQTWFLKRCLQAMNEFHEVAARDSEKTNEDMIKRQTISSPYGKDDINTLVIKGIQKNKSWEDVVKENESASVKCIGINIETRPDHIDEKEVKRLRRLGVTKVEMGVQTTSDRVQEITKRGHDLASVRKATGLLKDAGFKISYHMMPNLPGSTIEIDKKMITELFAGDAYQPDYIKIYPCVVVPKSELALIHKKGGFKTYDDKVLEDILYEQMKSVPEWCRIDRVARDIPSTDVMDGFKASNIRQILEARLKKAGTPSRDIRSREIKDEKPDPQDVELVVREYDAQGGKELFISYEDTKKDTLIALLRLRFPKKTCIKELKGSALIREVHVYGKQIPVGYRNAKNLQHAGWGTTLLRDAERLACENGYKKMAIIAGIGTREYYAKKGYSLQGTYMTRKIDL